MEGQRWLYVRLCQGQPREGSSSHFAQYMLCHYISPGNERMTTVWRPFSAVAQVLRGNAALTATSNLSAAGSGPNRDSVIVAFLCEPMKRLRWLFGLGWTATRCVRWPPRVHGPFADLARAALREGSVPASVSGSALGVSRLSPGPTRILCGAGGTRRRP